MREGWQRVALGDLFETTNNRLGSHREEPEVFSVTKYDGFVPAADYFGKRIASAKLDTYKLVEPDEWAYSTIHIDEGSIARNRLGRRGVVSPMYTTMSLRGARLDPDLAELVLRSPEMLATYGDAQQGSINRRRSLPWKSFAGLMVNLPPLKEQRRIVELVGVVDDTITAADRVMHTRRLMTVPTLVGALEKLDCNLMPLSEIAAWSSGTFLPKKDRGEGSVRVYGANGVTGLTTDAMFAEPVLTVGRVGSCGAVNRTDQFSWVTDNALIARPKPGFDLDLVEGLLIVADLPSLASKTAQPLIRQSAVKSLDVRVPHEMQDRHRFSELFRALTPDPLRVNLENLQRLRSNLLTALLSGEHEIPESYDELLEVNA